MTRLLVSAFAATVLLTTSACQSKTEIRSWVEESKGATEGRAATFYKSGYAEVISYGPAFEPPDLGG